MRAILPFASAAAVCIIGITAVALPSSRTLMPYHDRALPESIGKHAHDLTWSGRNSLMIATEQGVFSVTVSGNVVTEVIKGLPVPDGLYEPTALSSDGKSVSAISWNSNGGFALRLVDHKRLLAQRSARLIPMDVAVSGDRTCVVGFAPSPTSESQKDAAAWCGGSSNSWAELKPLHYVHGDHAHDLFLSSPGPFGGRIAIEPDGTVDIITLAQTGMFRYGSDGKFIEVLGKSIDDLVLESVKEIRGRFASDLENRYRLLLNAQPIIDDLVVTPNGPAIVVRLADGDRIHWELWYPLRSGGVGDRIRLGVERVGPYGHLRCDTYGSDLACIGSQPPRNQAAVAKTAQSWPHLWLFHLPPKSITASR